MEPGILYPESSLADIERTIRIMLEPAQYVELRVLNAKRGGKVSGYYDLEHRTEMALEALRWSGNASGVYSTLNEVMSAVACRSLNSAQRFASDMTKDNEIERRINLLLDFDPKR